MASISSLFVLRWGHDLTYLLLYVDNIVLTVPSTSLLQQTISLLHGEFSMKDLGPLYFFLGISVAHFPMGFFLSKQKYVEELLNCDGMTSCKSTSTTIDTRPKVSAASGTPLPDDSIYWSLVGALQYVTLTRPDIDYAVQ